MDSCHGGQNRHTATARSLKTGFAFKIGGRGLKKSTKIIFDPEDVGFKS
jgi:hypothetical protein